MRQIFAIALCAAVAAPAGAQTRGPVMIRVRVVDTVNTPIATADVSVVRGLNEVLATGTTDRTGVKVLRLDTRADDYQVIARKVGFARASKFLFAERADTLRVDIVMSRLAQQLDTVKVTAEMSKTRQRRFIDADAIAASSRALFDAIDVIEKLRPGMTIEPPDFSGRCQSAKNLWVNGVRVTVTPTQFVTVIQRGVRTTVPRARVGAALQSASDDAVFALSTIKPEHIASIEYHDCNDVSVEKIGGESAIFVVLKDGVYFRLGKGSYVISPAAQDSALKAIVRTPDAALERFRLRILGLFDADTFLPIDSADVVEVSTGTRALTSETGTVSLAFMQTGGGLLRLTKAGYRSDTITVTLSPRDTNPLTLVLYRIK